MYPLQTQDPNAISRTIDLNNGEMGGYIRRRHKTPQEAATASNLPYPMTYTKRQNALRTDSRKNDSVSVGSPTQNILPKIGTTQT